MDSMQTKISYLVIFMFILLSGCRKDDPTTGNFPEISFPDEKSLSWDYPVKPGSDKWKTFQSHDEMVEACDIPESVLPGLKTEELLLICLNYPLLSDIGAFNFFADGYAAYEMNSNGIREFYQRKDAPTVIYNYYKQLQLETATMYSSYFFVFKVSVVEYILSAPPVISKYTSNQRKQVASELLLKLNIKKSQRDDFSFEYLNSTYLALIKVIKSDTSGKLSAEDEKLAGYFTGMFPAPENIIKQVEQMINHYL